MAAVSCQISSNTAVRMRTALQTLPSDSHLLSFDCRLCLLLVVLVVAEGQDGTPHLDAPVDARTPRRRAEVHPAGPPCLVAQLFEELDVVVVRRFHERFPDFRVHGDFLARFLRERDFNRVLFCLCFVFTTAFARRAAPPKTPPTQTQIFIHPKGLLCRGGCGRTPDRRRGRRHKR